MVPALNGVASPAPPLEERCPTPVTPQGSSRLPPPTPTAPGRLPAAAGHPARSASRSRSPAPPAPGQSGPPAPGQPYSSPPAPAVAEPAPASAPATGTTRTGPASAPASGGYGPTRRLRSAVPACRRPAARARSVRPHRRPAGEHAVPIFASLDGGVPARHGGRHGAVRHQERRLQRPEEGRGAAKEHAARRGPEEDPGRPEEGAGRPGQRPSATSVAPRARPTS